jgi:hypothetical protein
MTINRSALFHIRVLVPRRGEVVFPRTKGQESIEKNPHMFRDAMCKLLVANNLPYERLIAD